MESARRTAAHIPLAAILLIVGAVGCFTLLDATVKHLAARYPVPLLVWARYLVQAVAMVLWLAPTMGMRLVRTPQPALQLARGTILLASSVCFVNALRLLPLAEATAINYTTPTLVILLSVVVLKERMTRPRWAFVVAGMAGMLLIVRPGAAILHGGAVLALAAALFYALFQIMTRKLAAEDPRVTLFYPALAGSALMTLCAAVRRLAASTCRGRTSRSSGSRACSAPPATSCSSSPSSARRPRGSRRSPTCRSSSPRCWDGRSSGSFPTAARWPAWRSSAAAASLLAWHERRIALAATQEPTAVD